MVSDSRKDFARSDGRDTIVFTLTLGARDVLHKSMNWLMGRRFGEGRTTSDACALARPYKQLFESGKPVGKINYVFFKGNKWPSSVLGSLCFTPGRRVLFYPGVVERKINWVFSKKGFQSVKSTGFVDHVTLENGFESWHITVLEPDGTKKHLKPTKTKVVDQNTIYWFGLTLQNQSVLEITPEELRLAFSSPPKDSDRRTKLLIEARKNAIFHLTCLEKTSIDKWEFLHFDFFVGPSNMAIKNLPCFVPIRKPMVYDYAQTFREGTPFRCHPVSLEGISEKIWIVVSKHKGRVSDKALFTIAE